MCLDCNISRELHTIVLVFQFTVPLFDTNRYEHNIEYFSYATFNHYTITVCVQYMAREVG